MLCECFVCTACVPIDWWPQSLILLFNFLLNLYLWFYEVLDNYHKYSLNKIFYNLHYIWSFCIMPNKLSCAVIQTKQHITGFWFRFASQPLHNYSWLVRTGHSPDNDTKSHQEFNKMPNGWTLLWPWSTVTFIRCQSNC